MPFVNKDKDGFYIGTGRGSKYKDIQKARVYATSGAANNSANQEQGYWARVDGKPRRFNPILVTIVETEIIKEGKR